VQASFGPARLAAPDSLHGSLIILAVTDEELSDEVPGLGLLPIFALSVMVQLLKDMYLSVPHMAPYVKIQGPKIYGFEGCFQS